MIAGVDPLTTVPWGRGIAGSAALGLPPEVVAAFAVLTQLGDVWFLFLVFTALYWFDVAVGPRQRREAAFLIAVVLGAMALTVGLKSLFALPRPPGAGEIGVPAWVPTPIGTIYREAATAGGFRFPSGHALVTSVAYAGLALIVDVSTRRRRAVAAGAVILVVCLARVVLGVHYPIDVIAGAAIGLAYLAVVWRLTGGDPKWAFPITVAIGAFAVVAPYVSFRADAVTATGYDAVAALGAAMGGAIAWWVARPSRETYGIGPGPAAVGLVLSGTFLLLAYGTSFPLIADLVLNGLAVGTVIGLPGVLDALKDRIE